MSYLDILGESAHKNRSLVCLGLDPVVEALPEAFRKEGIVGALHFFLEIFQMMKNEKVLCGAFKLNQGFYLVHDRPFDDDFSGSRVLARLIKAINELFPGIPVILDSKRGDIKKSSANYALEAFTVWQANAVTVSPYMGSDSVSPFSHFCSHSDKKGIYVLNRNSNPGAKDFQDLPTVHGKEKMPLYKAVAEKIAEWAEKHPGVGAVIGAVSLPELRDLAGFYHDKKIPLLIPGVGSHHGTAREAAHTLRSAGYELSLVRINSSRGITHHWHRTGELPPDRWEHSVVDALRSFNHAIDFR
ncbi:MAG: orotidine-5'-phosphate decarboxylase [Candidatus Eremiobacteraeota bacterium]|nr:orotidine-5'-phosphate decarboxylase [Candidatus Eremiobacteraeota bacterium]